MDDSLEDMVSRFLLGERKLLEKEIEGEPTIGHREPTADRFALVDQLYQEHRQSPMSKDQFEQRLRQAAGAADSEQRDQAAQMLGRWDQFHLMGQPVAQREPLQPGVRCHVGGRPAQDATAGAQHVGAVGELQGLVGELLDQQDGDPFGAQGAQ